ncbi:hypothetical protein HW555_011922 [Spodoptera exigua]|uniref:CCHC-type domain-containing protein n=1 Tax=Spodoptera exigua TaxID=7107 RepID=A0A835G857_SPOEX|nr:hypothetical protein HW555_011922 [Spodoptera exigua]
MAPWIATNLIQEKENDTIAKTKENDADADQKLKMDQQRTRAFQCEEAVLGIAVSIVRSDVGLTAAKATTGIFTDAARKIAAAEAIDVSVMGGALGVVAVVVAAGRSAGMRVRAAAAADRDLRAMPGACLLRWGDDQIIHYALPKLSGVAKTWYQALPTMSFSWPEWKQKLLESFPSSDDYAELLTEMLSKRKRAVDCLLYGIEDRSLRLGAKALKCQEPEQVLQYFQSIKQQPRETDRSRPHGDKKPNALSNAKPSNESKATSSSNSIVCYNCNEPGHFSYKCTKKILKCNICSKLGHTTLNCPKLPSDNKNNTEKEGQGQKNILRIDAESTARNDCKYIVQLMLNGQSVAGFVDLGSQCTLIRCSDARRLGINWSNSLDLPMMRGIGNNVVLPVGLATVTIQIQDVLEKVDALIVEDNIIKYPVLIGHSFTERPGIIITKTYDSLIFTRELTNKLHLELVSDTSIRAKEMCLVEVSSTSDYSGPVYVRGSLRGKSGHEFYLLPGEYELDNGRGRLLILNISDKLKEKYQENEPLWNPRHMDFKNRNKRNDAIRDIASVFNIASSEIERKLKNLSSHYFREKRKYEESKRSGSGREDFQLPKWFAYKALSFVSDKNAPVPTLNSHAPMVVICRKRWQIKTKLYMKSPKICHKQKHQYGVIFSKLQIILRLNV